MSLREQLDQTMGPASELNWGDMTCWSPDEGSHPFVGPSWLAPKLNHKKTTTYESLLVSFDDRRRRTKTCTVISTNLKTRLGKHKADEKLKESCLLVAQFVCHRVRQRQSGILIHAARTVSLTHASHFGQTQSTARFIHASANVVPWHTRKQIKKKKCKSTPFTWICIKKQITLSKEWQHRGDLDDCRRQDWLWLAIYKNFSMYCRRGG